jgi:hypothetical protein
MSAVLKRIPLNPLFQMEKFLVPRLELGNEKNPLCYVWVKVSFYKWKNLIHKNFNDKFQIYPAIDI